MFYSFIIRCKFNHFISTPLPQNLNITLNIFYKLFSKLQFIFQTNLCKIDQIYLDDVMRIFKSGLKQEITLKMTILVHYKLDKITISTDTTFTQFFQNIRQNKRCP